MGTRATNTGSRAKDKCYKLKTNLDEPNSPVILSIPAFWSKKNFNSEVNLDAEFSSILKHLHSIADKCPRSMSAYIRILQLADSNNQAFVSKFHINEVWNESFTKFRNDIRSLAREGFVKFSQKGDDLHIKICSSDQ